MPLKPHPTDPDKLVYVSRQYDFGRAPMRTRIELLSRLTQEELDALNEFYPATPRPWAKLMRGVRVENNTVIISLKGGNDAARQLCNELIREMEA